MKLFYLTPAQIAGAIFLGVVISYFFAFATMPSYNPSPPATPAPVPPPAQAWNATSPSPQPDAFSTMISIVGIIVIVTIVSFLIRVLSWTC